MNLPDWIHHSLLPTCVLSKDLPHDGEIHCGANLNTLKVFVKCCKVGDFHLFQYLERYWFEWLIDWLKCCQLICLLYWFVCVFSGSRDETPRLSSPHHNCLPVSSAMSTFHTMEKIHRGAHLEMLPDTHRPEACTPGPWDQRNLLILMFCLVTLLKVCLVM